MHAAEFRVEESRCRRLRAIEGCEDGGLAEDREGLGDVGGEGELAEELGHARAVQAALDAELGTTPEEVLSVLEVPKGFIVPGEVAPCACVRQFRNRERRRWG